MTKNQSYLKVALNELLTQLIKVKDRKQMLPILFDKVNEFIKVDDIGLFQILKDGRHRDFAVDFYAFGEAAKQIKENEYIGLLPAHKGIDQLRGITTIKSKIDFERMLNGHPHSDFVLKSKLKQFIATPLIYEDSEFGLLFLWSNKEAHFTEEDIPICREIAKVVSIVLNSIIEREDILLREKEKIQLLKITENVAKIRTLPDFLKFTINELKPIFNFHDVGIFLLTENGKYHYDLAAINPEISPSDFNYCIHKTGQKLISHQGSIVDYMMSETNKNNNIALLDFRNLKAKFPEYYQIQIMNSLGYNYRDCLVSNFILGDKILGMFCINALEKDSFPSEIFPFFKSVTEQLSVAISNILNTNSIIREKEFSSSLLNITQGLVSVTDVQELYKVMFERIKPIFPYDELGLFALSENGEYHYELISYNSYKNTTNQGLTKQSLGRPTKFMHKHTSVEWLMNNGPVYIAMKELNSISQCQQYRFIINTSLKQFIGGPLTIGSTKIGMLCFISRVADFYSDEHVPLFTNILEQVSVVVSNILAKEATMLQKVLNEKLLNVSNALTTVTDELELYRVIFDSIKPLINYDEFSVFVLDETGSYHYELNDQSMITTSIAKHIIGEKFGKHNRCAHRGSLVEWIMKNGPLIEPLKGMAKEASHPQLEIMVNSGLEQIIGGPLIYAGKHIGMVNFTSRKTNQWSSQDIPMFKAITEQISVVVSNILSKNAIEQEKELNQKLLTVSKALATANTTELLFGAIDKAINPILPYDDFGIYTLNESGDYFQKLVYSDFPNKTRRDKDSSNKNTDTRNVETSSLSKWIMNKGAIITTREELSEKRQRDLLDILPEKEIEQIIASPLMYGDNSLGFVFFGSKNKTQYLKDNIPLFQSVSEQVSVAVANILNRKKIVMKNALQSFELEVSREIETDSPLENKCAFILKCLGSFIPFAFAIVIDRANDRGYMGYDWVGKNELRFLNEEKIKNVLKLSKKNLNTWLQKSRSKAVVNSKGRLQLESPITKFESVLRYLFESNKEKTAFEIFLFHNNAKIYTKEHLNILNSISNTLIISFDNSCAKQEIKELTAQLQNEKSYLETVVKEAYNFNDIVGESFVMQKIFGKIKEVSTVDATVLLLGETGTGKELIARAIHENSNRKNRVLVKVNCAAIPSQIVESELFGHERGAFTGAIGQRIGKFELANGGTIFLDEIGEMPLELQAKLLRVLQEREVERLGSNTIIKLDIRIIAATNRVLAQEIENGNFREDLYYRLNGYPIEVPPLGVRGNDTILLAEFFAKQFAKRYGLPFRGISKETKTRFLKYTWPGNVRELQNLMEQAIISQKDRILRIYPGNANMQNPEWIRENDRTLKTSNEISLDKLDMEGIKKLKDDVERKHLLQVLEYHKWKVSGKKGAARRLGIQPTTLEYRMKRLGITRSQS